MARDIWYRLDNIGKFYSSQAGSAFQTVFRYAVTLRDDIDPEALQEALDTTVAIFPSFNVCLRSGMFWYYLEQLQTTPKVSPENLPICYGLRVDAKSVLFRVSYYRQRINVEVSHMISDGRGTLGFFKALIYAYVQRRYGVTGVPVDYEGTDRQKTEDSFSKYYERTEAATSRGGRAYRISGWKDEADPSFLEYHLPADRAIALAKSHGVGITAFVMAALICAIRQEMPLRQRNRPINIDIPVDLRQHFKSLTTKNFFGLAHISYVPGEEDEPIGAVAAKVQAELKTVTTAQHLKPRMYQMIRLEKNPLLRLSPRIAKDVAIDFAARLARRESTATVSNLGRIDIDERIAKYLCDINVLTSTKGMNFVICSFANVLSIEISTVFANTDIIKDFCRIFSDAGVEGSIHINKGNDELAEDRREARLEASLKRLGGRTPILGGRTPILDADGDGARGDGVRDADGDGARGADGDGARGAGGDGAREMDGDGDRR
ncbi:MAG: hypothetical protein LBO07_06720 [Coriobacteriales bacterium]|nr:hypothetical protein [Coriobacteriales bacterium]